jgi:hypothetical protein
LVARAALTVAVPQLYRSKPSVFVLAFGGLAFGK